MSNPRGRPRFSIRKVQWSLMIPCDLAAELELLLHDPLLDHVKLGARSNLVEALLRNWITQQKKAF